MSMSMIERAPFADRADAGRRLAARLKAVAPVRPVVLALPRGGVPVAAEIARELRAPLDLLLVRKIGVPEQEELALGAVVDGADPRSVINEGVRRACGIDDAQLAGIVERELAEIERRRELYLRGRAPVPLEGATAIVVDDGIATGATMSVALDALRERRPARTIIATGVAAIDAIERLAADVDDVVCLLRPDPMHAVGLYYEDFDQVGDREVVDLIASAASA